MAKLTREQAFAFIATLWPAGHMSYLDNPTRTYFSALIGFVPQGEPYSETDINHQKLKDMAVILRSIADHIEISGKAAQEASLISQEQPK